MRTNLTGPARDAEAARLAALYKAGDSIRGIAASSGRSYGSVRQLLLHAKCPLRPRGGTPTQRPA
ncbi:helix-turn-helix domain-containing protein [Streptomyces syringium]|uniref:helix-turn-helix domain-containing protein n=1 Tax=Streptomyces syringium TaxID=76729 RepID=UPI0033EA9FE4